MHVIYTPERFIQKSSGFNFGAFLFFSLGFQAHSSPGRVQECFWLKVRFLLCVGTYFLTDKDYFVIIYRHLIDFDYVRLQSFEKSGTGLICVYHREVWLIMKGYSKKLNLCHKPLPSVLWAYVMSMWYVQK